MRLINVSTLELYDFSFSKSPAYAILSHTWGLEEMTFQEMSAMDRDDQLDNQSRRQGRDVRKKKGFEKIVRTCKEAKSDGLEWVWIDTCCIDKSSSAELTESINSMYRWYKDAEVCYAFLEDVDAKSELQFSSRWFNRG